MEWIRRKEWSEFWGKEWSGVSGKSGVNSRERVEWIRGKKWSEFWRKEWSDSAERVEWIRRKERDLEVLAL